MPEPALLQVLVGCSRCGSAEPGKLYAPFRDGQVCAQCWHLLGEPFPRFEAPMLVVHEAELRTRERMTARGGTDRHLVRAGKT